MQTAGPTTGTDEPAAPAEGRTPSRQPRWGRRLLVLLLAVAIVAAFAGAAAVVASILDADDPVPRPAFAERVEIVDGEGAFAAATTNLGRRGKVPTCTVRAFDVYGNVIGSRTYELEKIRAGETVEWDGSLRVAGTVERMAIACR